MALMTCGAHSSQLRALFWHGGTRLTFLGGSMAMASFGGMEIGTGLAESCLSLLTERRNCIVVSASRVCHAVPCARLVLTFMMAAGAGCARAAANARGGSVSRRARVVGEVSSRGQDVRYRMVRAVDGGLEGSCLLEAAGMRTCVGRRWESAMRLLWDGGSRGRLVMAMWMMAWRRRRWRGTSSGNNERPDNGTKAAGVQRVEEGKAAVTGAEVVVVVSVVVSVVVRGRRGPAQQLCTPHPLQRFSR